jgi:hypothetical protein
MIKRPNILRWFKCDVELSLLNLKNNLNTCLYYYRLQNKLGFKKKSVIFAQSLYMSLLDILTSLA